MAHGDQEDRLNPPCMSSDENSEQIQNEEEKTRRGEDEENVSNKTNNY